MKNFQDLHLNEKLITSLTKMGYQTPTPIQEKSIPAALAGKDIMGSAQTGTGKTAAFSIPAIEFILEHPDKMVLMLTPTRELGKQILETIHQMLRNKSKINTAFIIGGDPYHKQMKQLKASPNIIVGTPGRINDHLERGSLKLNNVGFLVLDETDRMLDMGFTIQLERILKYIPDQRQTLMFSATLPKDIVRMSKKYLNNPVRVAIGETNTVATNISQEVISVDQSSKYGELKSQLQQRDGSVIVFVKTKHGADRIATNLRRDGFTSEALHGDLKQNKRERVMQNLRVKNFRILIATDIAARGLDVPHIEHVINYDLPQVPEDFIHRIGRTARAGAKGAAISFVSKPERQKWNLIAKLINYSNDDENSEEFNATERPKRKNSRHRNASKFKRSDNKNTQKQNKPFKKKASNNAIKADNEGKKNDAVRNDKNVAFKKKKKNFGAKDNNENRPNGKAPMHKKPKSNKSKDTGKTSSNTSASKGKRVFKKPHKSRAA